MTQRPTILNTDPESIEIENSTDAIDSRSTENNDLNDNDIADSNLEGSDFKSSDFEDSDLESIDLEDTDLESIDLESIDLEDTDLDEIDTEDDLLDEETLSGSAQDDKSTDGLIANAQTVNAQHTVTDEQKGMRIDKLAARVFTEFSRAQLQGWINEDKLLVDGVSQKPKYRVKVGQTISLDATLEQHGEDLPENIPLQIVFEDETLIVVNKPVGMVVHPGAGNWTGTLVNALLYHYPDQKHLPRAGLVHRIDKDTSGLLLVAKTKSAQLNLTEQLKDKSVYRQYRCVVAGSVESLKRYRHINEPIGRHSSMRTKMTVCSNGRDAVTHLIDIKPLNDSYSLVDVQLETGRTHQIRVHLSHIGHPLVGDRVYGGRRQLRAGITNTQRQAVMRFPRQALHAYILGFVHPVTEEDMKVSAPLPEDIVKLIEVLTDDVDTDKGYNPNY